MLLLAYVKPFGQPLCYVPFTSYTCRTSTSFLALSLVPKCLLRPRVQLHLRYATNATRSRRDCDVTSPLPPQLLGESRPYLTTLSGVPNQPYLTTLTELPRRYEARGARSGRLRKNDISTNLRATAPPSVLSGDLDPRTSSRARTRTLRICS